jgi:hypothetical protein
MLVPTFCVRSSVAWSTERVQTVVNLEFLDETSPLFKQLLNHPYKAY